MINKIIRQKKGYIIIALSIIVDNIEPIVNSRYIPRFRPLVSNDNNRLAVNKPSIPTPSPPPQPPLLTVLGVV